MDKFDKKNAPEVIQTMMMVMVFKSLMALITMTMIALSTSRCPEGASAAELASYDECFEKALRGRGQKLHVSKNNFTNILIPSLLV